MNKKILYMAVLFILILSVVICWYEKKMCYLQAENARLNRRLANLEPAQPRILTPGSSPKWSYTSRQILKEGTEIVFRTLELNYNWQRPLYTPLWHSTSWNCERFSYIPRLVENNRHRVFIYQGGGSYWFDLSPAMGFTDDTSPMGIAFKANDEVAIIVLQGRVKKLKKINDCMVIAIEPAPTGYHIIAVAQKDYQNAAGKVVTPDGYELETPVTAYLKGSYQ